MKGAGERFDNGVEGTHFVQPDYLQATEEYPFPVIPIIHPGTKEIGAQLGPDI